MRKITKRFLVVLISLLMLVGHAETALSTIADIQVALDCEGFTDVDVIYGYGVTDDTVTVGHHVQYSISTEMTRWVINEQTGEEAYDHGYYSIAGNYIHKNLPITITINVF